jgi:hypothetical protein
VRVARVEIRRATLLVPLGGDKYDDQERVLRAIINHGENDPTFLQVTVIDTQEKRATSEY